MDVPRRDRGESRAKTTLFALLATLVTGVRWVVFILELSPAHVRAQLCSGRNLDAHHVLEHAIEAAEDGQLVDLLRHLLQRLELLQT